MANIVGAIPPSVLDVRMTRELFELVALVGQAMFELDPAGTWQLRPAATGICKAVDPNDPNLSQKALEAYRDYIQWAATQTVLAWAP